MKRQLLTPEWLKNWKPRSQTEVADNRVKGLTVRGGPSGRKVFHRFVSERVEGHWKRRRVTLGQWSEDGGGVTLDDARAKASAGHKATIDSTQPLTVLELAEAYWDKMLVPKRERCDEVWRVIERHIVQAQPYADRPAFGEWKARTVRPEDVAAIVERAMEERRTEENRRIGGNCTGRDTLRELKSMFGWGSRTRGLPPSPAAQLLRRDFGIVNRRRKRMLSDDEVRALMEAIDLNAMLDGTAQRKRIKGRPFLSATIRLAIALLMYVPVRSHSLVKARWSEFDTKAGLWTVPAANLKLTMERRAEAEPFIAPLPDTALAILDRLKALAGDSEWVLASRVDGAVAHVSEKGLLRALVRLQMKGRLALGSRIVIHDLRRSWRSRAGRLGVGFEIAERSLNHSLGVIVDTYAVDPTIERRTEAATLVANDLDRIRLGSTATVVPLPLRTLGAELAGSRDY